MAKSIERELTAIRNKYDEMVNEVEDAYVVKERTKKERIEEFFEILDEVRCPFKMGDTDGIMSITYNDENYVLVAISKDKLAEHYKKF